jgi:predicted acetylornithine/succinylornithine family transaminase
MSTSLKTTSNVIEKDQNFILEVYPRAPFVLTHGSGMEVFDSGGRSYLDFGAGIAVNALGHAHPEIVEAVQRQVAQLSHVCNLYLTAPQADLAEMLCQQSFADKVFFSNSGSEAIEAAIKFSRKYARATHGAGKTEIVAFTGSFHGRTIGALSATAKEKYQAPFRPLMPDVVFAPFNDSEALGRVIGPQTCAVIIEPVQGEGGVHVATSAFMQALRELCDRYGALLIFDEIQCGLGRTGKLWAYEHFDIYPDILTLAKALGGGLPIGATLVAEHVAGAIEIGDHGSTFGGGPVVSCAAQIVLQHVSDPAMLAHVAKMGGMIFDQLAKLNSPHIQEVRGLGLMVGIEMDKEVKPVLEAGYRHGLLLLNAGPNVLRLLPPLIVSEADLQKFMEIFVEIIAE